MSITFTRITSHDENVITPTADTIIELEQVKSVRLAVYDNHPKKALEQTKRFSFEVIYKFKTPQPLWLNRPTAKLRNWGSKLNNIKYKIPEDYLDDWYDTAFSNCAEFEEQYDWAIHCKLGARLISEADNKSRYHNVACQIASFAFTSDGKPMFNLQAASLAVVDDEVEFTQSFNNTFHLDKTNVFKNKNRNKNIHFAEFLVGV